MSSTTWTPVLSHPQTSTLSPLMCKAIFITHTYSLAHTTRGKLSSEASRADQNLRLLVGHANLLDSLMLKLAETQQEQESWFNQSFKGVTKSESSPRHVQWTNPAVRGPEEDWEAQGANTQNSSSDEDVKDEDKDIKMAYASLMLLSCTQLNTVEAEYEEKYEDEEEEDYESLRLTLSPSHSTHPPELFYDSDSDDDSSEEESMPPSPSATTLPTFSEKQRHRIPTVFFQVRKPS